MTITPELRGAATVARQVSTLLDVELPPSVTAAIERTTSREQAFTVVAPSPAEFHSAIAAAVKAKRDPAADPVVQTLVTRQSLVGMRVTEQIAGHLEEVSHAVFADRGADVVAIWRQALAVDAKALAEACSVLGPVSIDDVAHQRTPQPAVALAWATAKTSSARFDAAVKAWWLIADVARVAKNPHRRALVLGAVSLEQLRQLPAKPSAWEVVMAGVELDLATFDSWSERNAALDDEIAAEAAAAAAAAAPRRPSYLP